MKGREAWITFAGELDAALAGAFRQAIEQVAGQKPEKTCPACRGPLQGSCAG
jgi:anti-anti-sigma regulatory factor